VTEHGADRAVDVADGELEAHRGLVPQCFPAHLDKGVVEGLLEAVLLADHAQSALFVIGGVVLSLLLIGIRNAWDTVTYVVIGEQETPQQAARPRPT
jgi:hypothetical protein